jgi:hypothetical protein
MASPLKALVNLRRLGAVLGLCGLKIWCYININAGSLQLVSTKSSTTSL